MTLAVHGCFLGGRERERCVLRATFCLLCSSLASDGLRVGGGGAGEGVSDMSQGASTKPFIVCNRRTTNAADEVGRLRKWVKDEEEEN